MPGSTHSHDYKVTIVEKTSPPDGVDGGHWCRYVIQSGNSIMEGKIAGTLKEATSHADEIADQVNTRNTWGARKKK